MKKTFTSISRRLHGPLFKLFVMGLAILSLSACAFSEYGNRINREQLAISRLEDKRHRLETQYVIVLNSLESHPTDRKLIKEKDLVGKKLSSLVQDIEEKRKLFDMSVREWEGKIVKDRIEQEMVEKEVRENIDKDEDVEFENK